MKLYTTLLLISQSGAMDHIFMILLSNHALQSIAVRHIVYGNTLVT